MIDWGRFRLGLYTTAMAFVVVAVGGAILLLPFSVGYAIAFFVGTALVMSPLWAGQGILALILKNHYSKSEKVISYVVFVGMTVCLAAFMIIADTRNFP